mgnify:CR=1 FL=1
MHNHPIHKEITETIREYVIFLSSGNDIVHNGIRRGTGEMLRADFPAAAIIPADEVPANWKEMSVRNGQLVATSAAELAARRQAETERIRQETELTEQIVPGAFWIGRDGTKKQLYYRLFSKNTSAGHVLMYDVDTVKTVYGFVDVGVDGVRYRSNLSDYISVYTNNLYELCAMKKDPEKNYDYRLGVEYTKR